jgi:hypothetical protein
MAEKQRRIRLILDILKEKYGAKTHAELHAAKQLLMKERPQLFHGIKEGNICTENGPSSIYSPIKNQQDVDDLRNNMACGNYPLGMTDCEVIGINGDCGSRCPVLLREECEYQDEMLDAYWDGKNAEKIKFLG